MRPFLCGLIFSFVLAGFAEASGPILVWHRDDKGLASFMSRILASFEKRTKIRVKAEPMPDLQTALLSSESVAGLPDIVLAPSNFVGLRKELQLSPVPPTLIRKGLVGDARRMVSLGENLYGVPIILGNHLLLFFNKKMVGKAASSWEELRSQAGGIRKNGHQVIGWNFDEPYYFTPFLLTAGGWPLNGNSPKFARAPTEEALSFYKRFVDEGLVPKNCSDACDRERFYAREFAYALAVDWQYHDARVALGDDLGVTRLPDLNGKRMESPRGCQALLFPRHSLSGARGADIRKLAQYLESDEIQKKVSEELERMPVTEKLLEGWEKNASRAAILASWKQAADMPTAPALAYTWPAIRRGIHLFVYGGKGAAEVITEMQAISERKF